MFQDEIDVCFSFRFNCVFCIDWRALEKDYLLNPSKHSGTIASQMFVKLEKLEQTLQQQQEEFQSAELR